MASLNETILHSSFRVFNRQKLNAKSPSISNLTLDNRSFEGFDFSAITFQDCTFSGCSFGHLKDVVFQSCTFERCSFSKSSDKTYKIDSEHPDLKDVLFYRNRFRANNFTNCVFAGVAFSRPTFLDMPDFSGCEAIGPLIIHQGEPARAILRFGDMNIVRSRGGTLRADGTKTHHRLVNWSTIRVMSQLPFLQLSVTGLAILSVTAIFNGLLASYYAGVADQCQDAAAGLHLEGLNCSLPRISTILGEWNASLAESAVYVLMLGAAALVQKVAADSRLTEFSKAEWNDRGRPVDQYDLIAQRRSGWAKVSAALYVISLVHFLQRVLGYLWQIWT